MIRKLSEDFGSGLYHDGVAPDMKALRADDRVRSGWDGKDMSAGDYTYVPARKTLYLTAHGTKVPLWQWDKTGRFRGPSYYDCNDRQRAALETRARM